MGESIDSNPNSLCLCGSPLQLDLLSLNRKLFGDQSTKLYCLPCLANLFECAVDDVAQKLAAFKREGCRLFPAQVLSL